MAIYLKNATFLDWESLEVRVTHVEVRPGRTLQFPSEIPADMVPGDETIDCTDRLVTRSLACGHHHIYSALALGMPPPRRTPRDFHEILRLIWWRLDRCLDEEIIRASALATAVDAARRGVTFVVDHHSSPNAIAGSQAIIAEALDQVGLSSLLCYEMSDRDGPECREQGLEETDTFLSRGGQGLVGLHASFTVGDDLLRRAVELTERHDTGVHIHVAEDPVDQKLTIDQFGKPVVTRLADAGALASHRAIASHCLHLSASEREILAGCPAWIAQNTESNLNNNVGVLRSDGFEDKIMLGTDGMHNDMFRAAQVTYLVGQGTGGMDAATAYRRLRAVHRYLAGGGFRGDGPDNVMILKYPIRTEIDSANALSHLIYGIGSDQVETVISDGRVIVSNGEVLTVDDAEITAFSREMGKKLWRAMEKISD